MTSEAPTGLRDLVASGDPFGGRRNPAVATPLIIQATDGVPLYLALTRADISGAARALASAWRTLGVRRGDHVLIYDYGTSIQTLFASWCYVPWLRRGAADILGAVPICNDGLPEFADRALHVIRYLRPRVTVVDRPLMSQLLRRIADQRANLREWTEMVVVSPEEEGVAPDQVGQWSRELGLPVRLLLRSGPALFFAAECEHGAFHADPRHYQVGVLAYPEERPRPAGEGSLCITNRFLRGTPVDNYLSTVDVAIRPGLCACGRTRPIRCLT
jgi:phenylacetate-coenzyme A ligase PaaK-like adenylate-forming protein